MIIKRKFWLFLFVAAILCAFGIWKWRVYQLHEAVFNPLSSVEERVLFEVPKGVTVTKVCRSLENKGLIKDAGLLVKYIRKEKITASVKAGEYILSSDKSAWDIFVTLTEGKNQTFHRFTIPEGYNIYRIAELVEKNFSIPIKDFLDLCQDKILISSSGINGKTLEGYLFPDTYFFGKDVKARTIIQTMVRRFLSVVKPEYRKRARESGYSLHQIVTLASLIEKETARADERATISAVYHQRLKRRMRLQCDPSVIYGIPNFNGNLTKKNLLTPSPYNTYLNFGLPLGPIANPGIESIKAALYPSSEKVLYFVSKNDGSHHFSYNLKEHNRAVRKYQKRSVRKLKK